MHESGKGHVEVFLGVSQVDIRQSLRVKVNIIEIYNPYITSCMLISLLAMTEECTISNYNHLKAK